MHVLIASDSAAVRAQVKESVPDPSATIREVTRGVEVLPAIKEQTPDIAVVDLQIGKMGGMAVCCNRPTLTRLLHTTGFDRIVTVTETLDEAASSLVDDQPANT